MGPVESSDMRSFKANTVQSLKWPGYKLVLLALAVLPAGIQLRFRMFFTIIVTL